jgi:tellurite resistance protein TerC
VSYRPALPRGRITNEFPFLLGHETAGIVFGMTQEAYIVFTANAFALMGLRQMFLLLDGLLDRLIYLSLGLAVVLGFIGVKLILHAGHEYGLPVPDVSTPVSLMIIVVTHLVTVVASLAKVRRDPEVYASHDHRTPPPTWRRTGSPSRRWPAPGTRGGRRPTRP